MIENTAPLPQKAACFQRDLVDRHLLEGLYVSITPVAPAGADVRHTVDQPGNVIHAGVWTGRYLAGVGYQYAVTQDPQVRRHGGELLRGLRTLQEVTGKPGLLARGFVKGHGPVEGWERGGADSAEWHQGQGEHADYRWYGDVSVDNFNAVLYGYAIYYDLAADAEQKAMIAHDVDRLMTHLLDHQCCIVDVDDEVTVWGHVGVDPDPARDGYYRRVYARLLARHGQENAPWRPALRESLMLLPDLLIAHHVTGKARYLDFYHRVIARFKDNPNLYRDTRPFSPERVATVNHSAEGQDYEALYNLIRYEHDPALLAMYRPWVDDLWDVNWMEGNALYTFMTLALMPEHRAPQAPGRIIATPAAVPHGEEGLRLALETLRRFPVDRVFRPVMNSVRPDVEVSPYPERGNGKQSLHPLPVDERPLDNEYEWKGSPYQMDGWLKPTVTAFQMACDDPQVCWFSDSAGQAYMTRDGGETWQNVAGGLMGARVHNLAASRKRTFVLHAQTDRGLFLTRDGGLSWRPAPAELAPDFAVADARAWQGDGRVRLRIDDVGRLLRSTDGEAAEPCMAGWRIPIARALFHTPLGFLASGPGGCYLSDDGRAWTEWKLWPEEETGAADFLHAYWMGRYYGLVAE